MLKQGVATEQMSTPTEAVETLTIQEKDMMGKIKQHLITAQDDGLQAPPVPSRSSRRITPHISQRLGNEIGDAHSKRRYYMRKGLFSNIGGNPKKKSIVKTERVSQNSHNVSGKQVKNNGSYSFRPIKGCTSQDGSIGAAIRGPHSFTGLANSSILR